MLATHPWRRLYLAAARPKALFVRGRPEGSGDMNPSARMSGKQSECALRLEILDGSIGLVTFDLPNSRANTLGQAVLAEFEALVGQLAVRTDLRGLILRSGKPG